MKKYKRRSIKVEAMQVDIPFKPIAEWCDGRIHMEGPANNAIKVPVEQGPQYAHKGEWIIKFPEGNFIILSDKLFKKNYKKCLK